MNNKYLGIITTLLSVIIFLLSFYLMVNQNNKILATISGVGYFGGSMLIFLSITLYIFGDA